MLFGNFNEFFMPPEAEEHLGDVKNTFNKSITSEKGYLGLWLSHHAKSEGKWIRAKLALASGELLQVPTDTTVKWASSCELIHAASLIHDDICDDDEKRRGELSLYKKFGTSAALCSGDFLIIEAYRLISDIEVGWHQTILTKTLSESVQEIIRGQIGDTEASLEEITIEEYERIAYEKTGPLLCLPMMGMFNCREISDDQVSGLKKLMSVIGLSYQMINDYHNMSTDKTDLARKHLNFINIINRNNLQNLGSYELSKILSKAKFLIYKKLQEVDELVHQVPVIIQPIFKSLTEDLRRKL